MADTTQIPLASSIRETFLADTVFIGGDRGRYFGQPFRVSKRTRKQKRPVRSTLRKAPWTRTSVRDGVEGSYRLLVGQTNGRRKFDDQDRDWMGNKHPDTNPGPKMKPFELDEALTELADLQLDEDRFIDEMIERMDNAEYDFDQVDDDPVENEIAEEVDEFTEQVQEYLLNLPEGAFDDPEFDPDDFDGNSRWEGLNDELANLVGQDGEDRADAFHDAVSGFHYGHAALAGVPLGNRHDLYGNRNEKAYSVVLEAA